MHAPQVFSRINLYSADTVTVHNRQDGLARVKVQLCRVAWRGNPTQVRERGRVEVIKMHSSIEIHMSLTAATLNCHPSAKLGYNDNPIFFSLFFTLSLFFSSVDRLSQIVCCLNAQRFFMTSMWRLFHWMPSKNVRSAVFLCASIARSGFFSLYSL